MFKTAAKLATIVLAAALSGCVSDGVRAVDGHVANAVSYVGGPRGEPMNVPLFVASTRRGEGSADDGRARYSLTSIGVPRDHRPGAIERPSFGAADRQRHFTVLAKRGMDEQEFYNEVAAHVSGRVGVSRDILLYVHGFNTGLDEARFRLAQIVADGSFSGVAAMFTWNSRGGLFNYESDKEAATVSRDALEKLLLGLAQTPGVGRVHILAHSMGAWLTMETLRGVAIAGHPDLDGRLGEVMLAAPDIDLNVFRQQIARLDPHHVSIFVASNDRALSISSRIAGDRPRLGALDPSKPEDREALDRLGVSVHDITSFSTDFVGHGSFAEAPNVVRQIGAQLTAPREAEADKQAVINLREAGPPAPPPSTKIETEPLPPLAGR
ncbi:alpha/beta hydrolase [Methylocystis sp. WRRC1]|uniref:alpha/beta hydrolase n=1 Tax=Methylocystis sp. WRRC1 TaxID=1732014 RepID=UPI001D14012D|nr:alpha/beta fold hydrolase [Methylocystis sp. WRRC1]MCC3244183.1 alpha/beta hydrolase [Methylocystis sp. WRRC1]